jgi:isoleucyl-tRNA synthetase
VEVQKELGIQSKEEVEAYGIDRFTRRCIESVWRYIDEWERMSDRIGFWLDREGYATYHRYYVESVWWALSEFFKQGLLYQGYKSVWWWPQGGTALSQGEVGEGYRPVDDPAVVVRFRLEDGRALLAWTTTPWTLPSNLALAVAADETYVEVEQNGEVLIVAQALADSALEGEYEVRRAFPGRELVGLTYEPLYRYRDPGEGRAYVIDEADFVTLDTGTGVVHIAPAFGEDDHRFGQEKGIAFLQLVEPDGKFAADCGAVAGMGLKEADKVLMRDLKERGLLYSQSTYRHDYPFCPRSPDDPLIQYARRSWFIRTSTEKDRVVANNAEITWQPSHIRDGRMGDFLRNNVDWAISRERWWGTPLPIWVNDETGKMESVGSVAEILERNPDAFRHFEKARREHPELDENLMVHKPWIDEVTWTREGEPGVYRRVPEVIDCWFDAGAMPFAQWGYPHRNRDRF